MGSKGQINLLPKARHVVSVLGYPVVPAAAERQYLFQNEANMTRTISNSREDFSSCAAVVNSLRRTAKCLSNAPRCNTGFCLEKELHSSEEYGLSK